VRILFYRRFSSYKTIRYINMDYLFFSTMQHAKNLVTLNISYDIACQWNKHLWDRMSQYPTQMHIERGSKFVTFLVPKFHLPAHIFACQIAYSHNLVKGMGRTDGEAPERGWANINPVATSTREMGPGSRRDTLDDHFGDFNWKKVTNLGKCAFVIGQMSLFNCVIN
jgi:Kyakuja-Dileera-Zisupton transposase